MPAPHPCNPAADEALDQPSEDGLVFGYRHVTGVPRCPCRDPGDYMMMERIGGVDRLRCWCGATCEVRFDDANERSQFIARQGG